jgi:membrane-bound lytic murein transglycosylase D
MRNRRVRSVVVSAGVVIGTIATLTSCATTTAGQPQQYRRFFVPPAPAPAPAPAPLPDPPGVGLYLNELPTLPVAIPKLTRPTDTEFTLRQAENAFAAGKKAFQEGRTADARREFNRAVQALLAAPENLPDRARIDRRLEELIEAIYRYDLDQVASDDADQDEEAFDQRPLDEILGMTFPVDPNLRGKVKKSIEGVGSELPLAESDAVVSYINYFTSTRGKKIMEAGLRRSGKYRDMIHRIFMDEGVPRELLHLAQAESGFLPRAVSPAKGCGVPRCVGMWQFAGFRGNEYGLRQTPATDDRMDPERATRAAARHLKDLFDHFGDWYLAMAAYNCGPGCVEAAVQRTGYADFWTLRRLNALPKETANYVPAILAMTIIAKNPDEYGLDVQFDAPLEYDTIELTSPTNVALIAAALDRPVSEIRDMNPGLTRLVAPANHYMHVPKGTTPLVESAFQVIPAAQRDSWRIHRIESGDNPASLAKRYGTTSTALISANAGELPSEGSWAAIPASYPGDKPVVVKKVTKATPVKPASSNATAKAPVKTTGKTTATKPTTGVKKVSANPAPTARGRKNEPVARAKAPARRIRG